MKHQITLLGGQISPVFWGIVEYKSDVVHILYTKESNKILTKLKRIINVSKLFTYQVDPNDFISTLEVVQNILSDNEKHDFKVNLTGGTKIMALACQNACNDLNIDYFYIDQKHSVFEMPSLVKRRMSAETNINTALTMAGSKSTRFSNPSQVYNNSDYELSDFIHINLHRTGMRKLQTKIVRDYIRNERMTEANVAGASLKLLNNIKYLIGKEEYTFKKTKSSDLILGRGLWWEILLSNSIKDLSEDYSHFMNVEFISENNNVLNEIDILLFDKRTIHFIEAKSGRVTQNDINKITAVRKLYGSVLSHSFLISRYSLRPDLLEKCSNLGIHVIVYGQSKKSKGYTLMHYISDLPKILKTKLSQRRI